MSTIGSNLGATTYYDRATQIEMSIKASNGRFTAEQVAARLAESDENQLKTAQTVESIANGTATYLGSSQGNRNFWDPAGAQKAAVAVSTARYEHYMNMNGPANIQALDVDAAVSAQGKMTGGDLKSLATYADYLRNEVGAATQVKSEVNFTGSWGKDRVTHDLNEYIGWLMQAAQGKSQTDA